MRILISIEEITKKIHPRIAHLFIIMCSVFVTLLLIDINFGFFNQIPRRSAIGIGKMAGSMALLFGGMTCLYYVLREVYVGLRRKSFFHTLLENRIKIIIQILRHIHPLCGAFVFLLVFSHAYILWYVAGKSATPAFYSGLCAFLLIGLVTAMGLYIVYKPNYLQLRKTHRILSGILIAFVALHLMIVSLK